MYNGVMLYQVDSISVKAFFEHLLDKVDSGKIERNDAIHLVTNLIECTEDIMFVEAVEGYIERLQT